MLHSAIARYNFTRAPFASIFMGCLSGAEPDVLTEHIAGLLRCFADEYEREGGPRLDADHLLLQFQLMFVFNLASGLTFIESDIYEEGPKTAVEWHSIKSKDDPLIMGRWNVRCRTIAILQSLGYWKMNDLHGIYVRWANDCGIVDPPQ